MPNRPSRNISNTGSRKDLTPMLAAFGLGGLEGGMSPIAPDTTAAATTLSPAMGDAMQYSLAASTGGISPVAAGGQAMNFTPYQASGWQNFLSRGQAGMQANQLNNQYYTTQLAGQNALQSQLLQNQGALDLAKLQGSNQLANTQAANQGAMDLANRQAVLAYATKLGIHPDSVQQAISQLDPQQIAVAKQQLENSLGLANMQAKIQATPEFYNNYFAGQNALASSQVAKNIAMAPVIGQNQAAFAFPSFGDQKLLLGPQGGGSKVTTASSFDPKTYAQTQTVTTSPVAGQTPRLMDLTTSGRPKVAPPSSSDVTSGSDAQPTTPAFNPYPTRQTMPGNFSPVAPSAPVGGSGGDNPFSFNPNNSAIDAFTQQQQEEQKRALIMSLFGQQPR